MDGSDILKDLPKPEPCLIVIFGITGDLSGRYLLPALYHLIKEGLLHPETEIIGISRRDISAEQLFETVEVCVNEVDGICDPVAIKKMQAITQMFQMDLDDLPGYESLLKLLNAIEDKKGLCLNRLYYLAIPPQVYRPIVKLMGQAKLNKSCQHDRADTRLLVEKPFGFDLQSAKELIVETAKVFGEKQIFRIDHYLAKTTVQNILIFRQSNAEIEKIWNGQHISSIEISASEKIGVLGRAIFYEPLGALRDFIQSHLLQILAIVTMDLPGQQASSSIHTSKQAVLERAEKIPANKVAGRSRRGQYDSYRQEVDNPSSTTETYAAIKVFIDNQRWQDIPIYIWSGKGLSERKTEIRVFFKSKAEVCFQVQPRETIELSGLKGKTEFSNSASYGHANAYEKVLVDAVRGDHTFFATGDEVLESWRIVEPVLDEWAKNTADLETYKFGSDGPSALT